MIYGIFIYSNINFILNYTIWCLKKYIIFMIACKSGSSVSIHMFMDHFMTQKRKVTFLTFHLQSCTYLWFILL